MTVLLYSPLKQHTQLSSQSVHVPVAVTLEEPQFRKVSDKRVKQLGNGAGINNAGQSAGGYVASFSSCACLAFVRASLEEMLAPSDLKGAEPTCHNTDSLIFGNESEKVALFLFGKLTELGKLYISSFIHLLLY